jgi:hypothetical protein
MTQFVVVDLTTQAAFLPSEVVNSSDRFLSWLQQFGEVGRWPVQRDGRVADAYAFRAVSGQEASFWFDEQDGLHVDHDDELIRQAFRRTGLLLGGVFLTMRKR